MRRARDVIDFLRHDHPGPVPSKNAEFGAVDEELEDGGAVLEREEAIGISDQLTANFTSCVGVGLDIVTFSVVEGIISGTATLEFN